QWRKLYATMTQERASDLILLTACASGSLVAASLARLLPGRAALVWLPQFADDRANRGAIAERLFERLEAELKLRDVHIAQALLSGTDRLGEALLEAGGFEHSAHLLYLAAPAARFPERQLVLPFEIEVFTA